MQTLAEDRWHDYTWKFHGNRFSHWEKGFAWLQAPELDTIGIDLADARANMSTIPRRGDDLAFYLVECPPLAAGAVTTDSAQYGQDIDEGGAPEASGLLERSSTPSDISFCRTAKEQDTVVMAL
jgi:hypothetical protein